VQVCERGPADRRQFLAPILGSLVKCAATHATNTCSERTDMTVYRRGMFYCSCEMKAHRRTRIICTCAVKCEARKGPRMVQVSSSSEGHLVRKTAPTANRKTDRIRFRLSSSGSEILGPACDG
jgi:hypothetical protein